MTKSLLLSLFFLLIAPRARASDPWAPRLELAPPPAFAYSQSGQELRVRWSGEKGAEATIRTELTGPAVTFSRSVRALGTHLEITDRVTNSGKSLAGARIRYAITGGTGPAFLGGVETQSARRIYSPWNPTAFVALGNHGLGLLAEEDVFRQQTFAAWDPTKGEASLDSEYLCLGPGESHEIRWSAYPVATDFYWDFINRVREDWGVNRTLPGSYLWFTPSRILATPIAKLRAQLERQGSGIASMWGGWVDHQKTSPPQPIGFGTEVLSARFAGVRERLKEAIAKLHEAKPGIRVLPYFDAQRESSPDATGAFSDARILRDNGSPDQTRWGGKYSVTWSVFPTLENAYGKALQKVPAAMKALGGDGLYWDEMDAFEFSKPHYTTGTWDGRSCLLDPKGQPLKKIGFVNLLSDPIKEKLADEAGFVLGNAPPSMHRFQAKKNVFRMIEAQHNREWSRFTNLSDPLGYGSTRPDWAFVTNKIEEGILPATALLDLNYGITHRLFPFTPEYIQAGTLRGKERIVTVRSGRHGWLTGGGDVRAWRYDSKGKESRADWKITRDGGKILVDVRLDAGEAAVLERVPDSPRK